MDKKDDNLVIVGGANDPFNETNKLIPRCHGIWDKELICQAADENVFRFLNSFRQRPLTDFIVEPEEFLKWWNALVPGEKSDFTTILRRGNGEERNVRFVGVKTVDEDGCENVELEMVDIFEAASEYSILRDEYNKLTSFVEHFEGCEFEYDCETKELSFFRYLRNKRIEEKDETLLALLPELKNRFENIIGTPEFIHELLQSGSETYHADGVALYSEYVLRGIYGRIRKNAERLAEDEIKGKTELDKLDSFTGLWNKVSALEFLRKQIEDSDSRHQIIVAIIDLDFFKIINDTYGHAFGDEVIMRMAQILKNVVGGRGIAARFGGDEFMLVLKDIGTETDLRSILESARTQLVWAFNERVKNQQITCTIGVAEYPRNGLDFDTIFNKADRALYIGKQKGKNRYIIYKENIHGELPKGDDVSLEQGIRDSLKVGEHLNGITWCLTRLGKSGTVAIKSVAEKLMQMYTVDRISIYTGPEMKLLECYGGAEKPLPDMSLILKPEHLMLFDDDGYCHIIFNHMISVFYEEFHGVLHKNGIYETNMFLVGNKRKPRGVVCFDRLRIDKSNSRKWSDEELHILLLLARCMGELVT